MSCRHCNWSPDVCAYVRKTSHRVCCVPCRVNLRTDSNNNLKIEKMVTMTKHTQPPLPVNVLAMTFMARTKNLSLQEPGVLERYGVLIS